MQHAPAWHERSVSECLKALGTELAGLPRAEAMARLKRWGENALQEPPPPSIWRLFLQQFQDFMVLILLGATVVAFVLGETGDAVTIVAIVLVNAILGFFQEYRVERSMAALKELTAPTARVRREGQEERIPAKGLVPGDILLLEAGDRVAADARLVESQRLSVDESPLTGESRPVEKAADFVGGARTPLAERRNMVYAGTTVVRGRGEAVVVATGMATEVGGIARLIQQQVVEPTPLQRRLEQVGKVLVVACLAITAVVTMAGILRGEAPYAMFLTGVSLAVAAIPEGLPAIVTIALAVGVQRMIQRRALVRRLPAVETLGAATVICSDKTGTLTKNEMTVRALVVDGQTLFVHGEGYLPHGRIEAPERLRPLVERLLESAVLCSDAGLTRRGGKWRAYGDPTELALLVAGAKAGIDAERLRRRCPRLEEEPFDPATRQMRVVVRGEEGPATIWKGAPEVILERAEAVLAVDGIRPLTPALKAGYLERYRELGRSSLRGLGVARKEGNGPVVFLGMVGMVDPPRPEVRKAIRLCQQAGVKVLMITGDHPATALAVARELGIAAEDEQVALGMDLEEAPEPELQRLVAKVRVFARVSPGAKLRLVRALKANGEVVAMTGDGVNDAPAVREADIGIAMGRSGTDVTKEASALILTDDNFATIVAAIEEGRGIYDNIRKFVRYLLSCNVGEILVMFLAAALALPMPLLPVQILWVNLVTDGLPAMALGVDPVDPEAMRRPPRDPQEGIFARRLGVKILTRGFLIGVATLAVFLFALLAGDNLAAARTMAFATLVLSQLIHAFDCRSETRGILGVPVYSNPLLLLATGSSLLLLVIAIYLPPLARVFQTQPLSASDWAVVLLLSALPSSTIGVRRAWLRNQVRRSHALGRQT